MPLPVPNLDDKRWSEIVDEAIRRIPLYSNQWTDHNLHDPGRTFIELFAWLAEFQRYRLAQTPNRTARSFLKLVGVAPRPLIPARVEAMLDTEHLNEALLLKKGTPLVPIGSDQIVFQVSADVFLTLNALLRVTTEFGDRRIDQSKANQAFDIAFFPFQVDAPLGAVLELEFKSWFSAREPEFDLAVQLFDGDLPKVGEHADEAVQVAPSVLLHWEYQNGSEWKKIAQLSDGTNNLLRSGHIRFQTPEAPQRPGVFRLRCTLWDGHYEIPPRIRRIGLNTIEAVQIQTVVNESLGEGTGKPDQMVALRHAPVLEVSDSALEVGDILDWAAFLARLADPNRTVAIQRLWRLLDERLQSELTGLTDAGAPALLGSAARRGERDVLLYRVTRAILQNLNEADFLQEDSSRESRPVFACSDRLDESVLSSRNRTRLSSLFPDLIPNGPLTLQVGTPGADGVVEWKTWSQVEDFRNSGPTDSHYMLDDASGQIRFGNGLNGVAPQPGQAIRARFYRHSRGEAGNLPPGQLWEIRQENIRVTGRNPQAAQGGRDIESIDDARLRAQERFHQRMRLLTADDFEELARRTPGLRVARARALANHHPDFEGLQVPGAVTVVVLPNRRPDDPRPPQPGRGFIETVSRHLEAHRLVATEVRVVAPRYEPLSVSGRVFLARRSAESEVTKRLRSILEAFFDPLTGGPEKTGWPFGRAIFPSEIYALLDQDPGVDYVVRLRLNQENVDEALLLGPIELPRFSWERTQLTFVPFEARSEAPNRPNCSEVEVHP